MHIVSYGPRAKMTPPPVLEGSKKRGPNRVKNMYGVFEMQTQRQIQTIHFIRIK